MASAATVDRHALRNRNRLLAYTRHGSLLPISGQSACRRGRRSRPATGRAPASRPARPAPSLPDVAQHLAAHAGLHGLAAGHDAARGRQDARPEPAQHRRHVVAAEVDAASRPADPLDAGDDLLAPRPVLERRCGSRAAAPAASRRLLDDLEALDVPLVLEDARDLGLQLRRRNLHARRAWQRRRCGCA